MGTEDRRVIGGVEFVRQEVDWKPATAGGDAPSFDMPAGAHVAHVAPIGLDLEDESGSGATVMALIPSPPAEELSEYDIVGHSLDDPEGLVWRVEAVTERLIHHARAMTRGELRSRYVERVEVRFVLARRPAVPAGEVMALFRRVLGGDSVMILRENSGWDEFFAGEMHFGIDGYEIVIFNDCGDLDYVDHVVASDGRRSEYEDWSAHGGDPSHLLSDEERTALLAHIRSLRP